MSAGRVSVYVTGTSTMLVVPTTIALPPLTTTFEKVKSGVVADAAGTARADRARAPDATAPMAILRMDLPPSRRTPGRCAPERESVVRGTVSDREMWRECGPLVKGVPGVVASHG